LHFEEFCEDRIIAEVYPPNSLRAVSHARMSSSRRAGRSAIGAMRGADRNISRCSDMAELLSGWIRSARIAAQK
jgi:hypothetical protein